ncbi:MAG: LytTR family DNA-binding domain-containing protein, partial [Paludibacteraceae bacterium]|nr:LytTR family DNA-binding domain-containing protein [Paludibacteraceae bacterium]
KPFSSDRWIDISSTQYFLYSCVIVFIGIAVIAVSRYLMNLFVRRFSLNNIEYGIWVILELVILSGFYTLYVLWMRSDLQFWSIEDAVIAFRDININTFLVVFFPYLISWLYFAYDDKNKRIRELEKRGVVRNGPSVLHFNDDKGGQRLSVAFEAVVYLESADNYIEINYLLQGKMEKFMLRNSMKRTELELTETAIQRCHRSYMVNFEHVTSLHKEGDDFFVEMDVPDTKRIPVSKTYVQKATEAFTYFGRRKAISLHEVTYKDNA